MKWITFFSQTGSEIVNLSEIIGHKPDLVVTNNTTEQNYKFHSGIRKLNTIIMSGHHDILMNYFRNQTIYPTQDTLITLHGYLRIIPQDICEKYEIYNGHPAPVHLYPELKGKDKQEDLYKYKGRYDRIGGIIHRVTPYLDAGEIVAAVDEPNTLSSIEESYLKIKPLSLKSWELFFNDYLPNKMSIRQ